MTRTLRAGALTAAALSLMLALAGCFGPTPAPTPTPDATSPRPTATAAPTAEPVDPLTSVTVLVARPDALELRDASGTVVRSLDYLSAPADAVATLTTAFGSAPVDEAYDGSSHFPPSTAHRWDGFELWEQRYVGRWEGVVPELSLDRPAFMVLFNAASAGGMELSTVEGRHAGEGWDDLMAAPGLRLNPSDCSGPYLDYLEQDVVNADGEPYVRTVSVEFRRDEDSASISSIAAPIGVYDGCA
jgi:hypothetical protein